MGNEPTTGQLVVLTASIAFFGAGMALSLLRVRIEPRDEAGQRVNALRRSARAMIYTGTLLALGVLVWHIQQHGARHPLEDNFGAFLSLAILLALFVAYTQRVHPLRGLDWFLMPVVLLLLVGAAVFGKVMPHVYSNTSWWFVVHIVTAYGGFVAFAIAGALGTMYLLANRRLRQKKMLPNQGFGSLERLEHLTRVAVTLGFALLTVGLVTGLFAVLKPGSANALGPDWYRNPKVILPFVAWIVYALVLHSPINPAFRGRRTAQLSVLGFLLMIGTFVAVQFMPAAR